MNHIILILLFLMSGFKMSWFTDLAGKAEDFLNKVDQGAATALSKSQERTSSFSSPYDGEATVKPEYNSDVYKTNTAVNYASSQGALNYISAAAGNIKKSNATLLAGTANVSNAPSSGSGSSINNSAKMSSGFVRPRKSEQDVDDDMLFDFLNSSDPPASNRRDSRREVVKVAVTEAQNPTPPSSTTPHAVPSAPSTPPSTRGVSRASSMSSLSAHSIKTSEESSAKEQSQGVRNTVLHVVFWQ